jgi:hypothetical protein
MEAPMRNLSRCLVVLVLSFVAACSGRKANSSGGSGDCGSCEAGQVCVDSTCKAICQSDSDCESTEICTDQLCGTGSRSNVPTVTGIDANGSATGGSGGLAAHRYDGELTILGQNLAGASAELALGTQSWKLQICSSTDTNLVATFPAGFPDADGTYILTVANQAGACNTTLPILKGETGGAGAQGSQGSPGVPCGSCVDSDTIADLAVTTADLADNAATDAKVVDTLSINNGRLYAPAGAGSVGVGTNAPAANLEVRRSAPIAGTGTLTSAAAAVTGSGTSFTTQISVGDVLVVGAQSAVVLSVTDNTHLATKAAFSPVLNNSSFQYVRPLLRLSDSSGQSHLVANDLEVDLGGGSITNGLLGQASCEWIVSPWSCTWDIYCKPGYYMAGLKDTGGNCPREIYCCKL